MMRGKPRVVTGLCSTDGTKVGYGREVARMRRLGRFAYPFLQIEFDCCYCRAVRLQHTGAIKIMRDNVQLWLNAWTKVHLIEVIVVDSDDRLFEYAG